MKLVWATLAVLVLLAGCASSAPVGVDETATTVAVQDEAPVEVADLAGSSWVLESRSSGTLPDPLPDDIRTVIRIQFEPDDRVVGQAFCAGYGGTYAQDGASIRLEVLDIEDEECGEPFDDINTRYIQDLFEVDGVAIADDQLTLTGPSIEYVFRAA